MSGIRIAIADDDRDVRDWLRLVLRGLGGEIVEAADGAELLTVLLHEGPFDLAVTDLRMPRLSGLAAARGARAAGLGLAFIFISGFGDEHTEAEVVRLGRAVFFAKPVDGNVLLDQVRRFLDLPRDGR